MVRFASRLKTLHLDITSRFVRVSVLAALLATPSIGSAVCNVIPGTERTFASNLGATNRPFAAPGEELEVAVRACDAGSAGFWASADDHVVSVIFAPPDGGARTVVALATKCSKVDLAACEAQPNVQRAVCREVEAGTDMSLLSKSGRKVLRFRFPDTDDVLLPASDGHGLVGAASIVVTRAGEPLPCGAVTAPCANPAGTIACIGDYFSDTGDCGTAVPRPTFSSFTALPPPNDYRRACFDESPPCTESDLQVRLAVDAAGNLLLPIRWSGVLVRDGDVPVPRLVRARIAAPFPFVIPSSVFLASYSPEGARIPPIFEPQFDPTAPAGVVTLFGSADAPYGVLRVGRHHGTCTAGPEDGERCGNHLDCPGGVCQSSCVDAPGVACSIDGDCPSGRCGVLFDAASFVTPGGGPLVIARDTAGPSFCRHDTSTCDDGCESQPCVAYALEAQTPVPLDGIDATDQARTFVIKEALDARDSNGDGDTLDAVMTLRSRQTGLEDVLGAPAMCGIPGDPPGRAVVRTREAPFSYPAVAMEGDLVAFAESEAAGNYCDQNGDSDRADPILRVFRLGVGELASPAPVVDPAPVLNGRSLVLSNGTVFYRRPEVATAAQVTEIASVATGGTQGNAASGATVLSVSLSPDGKFAAFSSLASNLVPGDSNADYDIFVRDREGGTTERVSVDSGELQADNGSSTPYISRDGQFVVFSSDAQNLAPGGMTLAFAVYLRDRALGTTERVSVTTGGGAANGNSQQGTVSDDGNIVSFWSIAGNLGANGLNLFVHDRDASTTTMVSNAVPTGNTLSEGYWGRVTRDGRWVIFRADVDGIVPGDENGFPDVYAYDVVNQTTELVSVGTLGESSDGLASVMAVSESGRFVAFVAGTFGTGPAFDFYVRDRARGITEGVNVGEGGVPADGAISHGSGGMISDDGRLVAFRSAADNIVPGDGNGLSDIFLYDRFTGVARQVNLASDGTPGNASASFPSVAEDGRWFAFSSSATNLVPGDFNGATDVFVRGVDTSDLSADVFPDGEIDDTVLEAFDTATETVTTLCPATAVAVADGRAAFLEPESGTGTAMCTAGPLNGDGDEDDDVVQCWTGAGAPVNLGRAATAVVASPSWLAALVDEAQDGVDHNLDIDELDTVAQLHPMCGGAWVNTGQAADRIAISGARAAFITPEAAQSAVLNGDGLADDRVLQVFDAGAMLLTNVGQAAEELVLGDVTVTVCGTRQLMAFRSCESAEGADLNGDLDLADCVLRVYDLENSALYDSGQAATPCALEACDPRFPYRVRGATVRFLTFESQQNADLDGDGGIDDLVLQEFDVCGDLTRYIATIAPTSGPITGPLDTQDGTNPMSVPAGRCGREPLAACTVDGNCRATEFCSPSGNRCTLLVPATCRADADCPPESRCIQDVISTGTTESDFDADGVSDSIDVCPIVPDPMQADTDGDGVGDACDGATCGDEILQPGEECDGVNANACLASCRSDCTCDCGPVVDAKAKIAVTTFKEKGQLDVRLALPLGSYAGGPVTVRIDDGDTTPIIRQQVTVAPLGSSGRQWQYKSKGGGIYKLRLKHLTPKLPGVYALQVKAKRWFTAVDADEPAASTIVSVGTEGQCFAHAATRKKD